MGKSKSLRVTYDGRAASLEFQAVKSNGVEISVRDLSGEVRMSDPTANWTILRYGGIGSAIMRNTTEADLKRIYGSANLTSENIDLGEGSSEPGTVLYPRDPLHRLEILWHEPQRLHPRTIMIRGEKSVWKTAHDISLGTTLMELERLNEKPFMLHGFAWDGSGGITSWQKGALETELGDPEQDWGNLARVSPASRYQLRRYNVPTVGRRNAIFISPPGYANAESLRFQD